jgi:ribosomal subunit interface protein
VDILVKGRHCEVSERFRNHIAEKLAKVAKLDPKVIRVDVEVSKEHNPRLSDQSDRIELTCRSRGPVIRAEASAADKYAALDLAWTKLEARLRKAADRRRVHHGARSPRSVAAATAATATAVAMGQGELHNGEVASSEHDFAEPEPSTGPIEVVGDGPLIVREKIHEGDPMTLDQALYEMELVGHDFYLFIDAKTAQPSVVYRRKGYDYGVIRLAV